MNESGAKLRRSGSNLNPSGALIKSQFNIEDAKAAVK